MRAIAASVRGDALNGVSREEQEHFVDTLLTIKSNLLALGNGNAGRGAEDGEAEDTAGADREVLSQ
jgi:hypothetical protein